MSISAKIYQITNPLGGKIYEMLKELGENLSAYSILDGMKYMYLNT